MKIKNPFTPAECKAFSQQIVQAEDDLGAMLEGMVQAKGIGVYSDPFLGPLARAYQCLGELKRRLTVQTPASFGDVPSTAGTPAVPPKDRTTLLN